MNKNVKEIILNTVITNKMIDYNDKIVIGVSGGADSMCLLHFLISIKDEYSLNITVAHINHNLRGAEAMRDQKLVEQFCKENKIKCKILSADIKRICAETKESCEECGRRIRYEFFNELCTENSKIATAHTLSDFAETMIFNIARGTGLKGLQSIPKIRGNIIRPLIDITRTQVEEYCKTNNINYIVDSSNLENDYNRNKIRNIVVPVLKEINPSFENSVARLSIIAEGYLSAVTPVADNLLESSKVKNGYNCAMLNKCDNYAILKQAIINILQKADCSSYEERHIDLILNAVNQKSGSVELPKGFVCSASQGILRVYKKEKAKNKSDEKIVNRVLFPKSNSTFVINNQKIFIEIISKQEYAEIANVNKLLVKNALDCDIIPFETLFRTRMPKDTFKQYGRGVTKSLKKLFTESKIPVEQRDNILVAVCGNTVLWVQNFGVSQEYAVTNSTKTVAVISVEGL